MSMTTAAPSDPTDPARRLLGLDLVAQQLGLARQTLYDLEKRGELRMVRIGGRTFVPAADLDAFLTGLGV